MSTLIVQNGSTVHPTLRAQFPSAIITPYYALHPQQFLEASLVILSGSSGLPLIHSLPQYVHEAELVLMRDKPTIGICFGAEIIGWAFGEAPVELPHAHTGIRTIHSNTPHATPLEVYEHHRFAVARTPKSFESLYESEHHPELFVHKQLPLVGIQFHPEKSEHPERVWELVRTLLNSR